jgi:hypothetical protein
MFSVLAFSGISRVAAIARARARMDEIFFSLFHFCQLERRIASMFSSNLDPLDPLLRCRSGNSIAEPRAFVNQPLITSTFCFRRTLPVITGFFPGKVSFARITIGRDEFHVYLKSTIHPSSTIFR